MHGIAASAFFFSGLPVLLVAGALAALALSLWFGRRGGAPVAGHSLVLREDGLATIGGHERCRVLPGTTDFGWAVWLHWADEGGRRYAAMLAPDMLPADDWRRLRIWLRHKAAAVAQPAATAG
ncbi:hypothetical protein E6O51_11645 [Pseudothauera rhizosphaerae]|uniref:Toxin CptA n=2 Tax=Pseudothauera rhizosphaerae TaxID=2565932 RepID=A0A4S4AMM9_9RHOO|nr:protein YgfX [Pseudothauera rhizosphaerae]THF60882.1 hypothetical protein E6O51_11645 [Pseudothauera rhizosphaerae]